MPTKGTSVITTRVKDELIVEIKRNASKRGITLNGWLNLAILQGLRKDKNVN